MRIMRLDYVLANMGYGSRKDVKKIIKNGEVTIDKIICKDCSFKVNLSNSIVEVNGKKVEYKEYIYLMMNKPKGIISATFDNYHKTVVDILPDKFKNFDVFPVGRLDIDTEGLLILTNDGKLSYELLSPKKHVTKKYFAMVEGEINNEDIFRFKEGVILNDGYKTLPADLKILKNGIISEIEVLIHEGKFHQVKRMVKSIGKHVIYLKRVKMGGLELDKKLKLGEVKELSNIEVELLQKNM